MKQEKEIDLFKLWQVLKLNQRKIWKTTAITTMIAVIYCIFATPIFTAKVTINPPKLSDAGINIGNSLGLGNFGDRFTAGEAGLLAQKTDAGIATSLLKTTQIMDMVIEKFKLIKYYRKSDIELTRKYLNNKVSFATDLTSGFVTISFEDKNPTLAMNIANYYVYALGQVISNASYSKSDNKQKFFLNEIAATKKKLSIAQQTLKAFILKNGITSGLQTNVMSNISLQLQARLVTEEAQLHSMSSYMTDSSPDYIKMQADIDSIKKQLSNISGQEGLSNANNLPIPANLAPELAIQYTDLQHDILLNTEILQILYKQYEAAKMDTLSEILPTSIMVVDPAVLPLHKSKPRRALIITVTFILSMTFIVLFILFKNFNIILVNKDL